MPLRAEPALDIPDTLPADDTTNRKNMSLLIQLRWIAIVGQVATIGIVQTVLGIPLPLARMAIVLAALAALNLVSLAWMRRRAAVTNSALLVALMLDVFALTTQLYFSGGASNPFTGLFLLQITLAAVLLDGVSTYAVVALACASFIWLAQIGSPLALPRGGGMDPFTLHIAGMGVCFVLDAALLTVFVIRMTRNLRSRDARLAALKQREAEEDHIVRMGLLASGAAHELGTPLASVSVILGDWRRMPEMRANAELAADIEEMQAAVERCKAIVTGILLSSGEARGDAPSVTTVNDFLARTVREWRHARSSSSLHFDNHFSADVSIVSDSILQQVVFNLLDNAFEASPQWLELTAEHDADTLVLRVADAGAGFTPEMLEQLGKPYRSSKGRLGGGLGLFLVVNVIRKLGGTVAAQNRAAGGAAVTLRLPLERLKIGGRGNGG